MCGIIGYTGTEKCVPVLLDGLESLAYRGYDSVGISVNDNGIETYKVSGRISALRDMISKKEEQSGHCGIGHTRWATHGAPTDVNAHPHCTDLLSVVHNGIIENYATIAAYLREHGYTFVSETDTEVAAKLIDMCYRNTRDPSKAMFEATDMMRGAYAFAVIFADIPDKIFAIRKDSPLIASETENGSYVASDITALVGRADSFFRPENGILTVISEDSVRMTDRSGRNVSADSVPVTWNVAQAERGGFEHFMLKEIHEEPEVLSRTLSAYIADGLPSFSSELLSFENISKVKRIHIVACGTAMHAGLIGKNMIEHLSGIPVNVEIASEFRYRDPLIDKEDLLILISQSGETADTLAVLRYAKSIGVPVLSVVNVIGSTIASESDSVIYTYAGPEIAVASTKAYVVQCGVMYLLAYHIALIKGTLSKKQAKSDLGVLTTQVIDAVKSVIENHASVVKASELISSAENLFYIGRCIDYDICTEGSLKLKEISYIHSEAFAAGELKHGTISLITEGTPVIALITVSGIADKMNTAVKEVSARGAEIIVVCTEEISKNYDFGDAHMIVLPKVKEGFEVFPAASVMQLLAYHTSVLRGNDVDKPRNLAKSVTVE